MKSDTSPVQDQASRAVPLLDLRRQYQSIRDEVLEAIARVCDSQIFILGPAVEALEREIATLTGSSAAVGCASGTEALWLALVASGVQPGDSVITTTFSFFASASAIVRAGAKPLLLDIDPGTLNLDSHAVERCLKSSTERVSAILPVHLYGQCADMDAFHRLSSEFNIPIVEDAAQAIGAEWKRQPAGSLGISAAFSFYPTKNLSAYGDAGIVTTSNPDMADHMRRLRNHGSPRRYYHDEFGWNGRIDAIQAAVLRVKLKHIDRWNDSRRQHADDYDRLFARAGLSSSGGPVQIVARDSRAKHVFHQYVIRAQRRDALRAFLSEKGIGSEIYYPLPIHLQPVFAYLGLKSGDLPVAEQAALEVIALPMFPELTENEIERVVQGIADFYA